MIAEAINRIAELVIEGDAIEQIEFDGRRFTSRPMHEVERALPTTLGVRTLTGIVDYVRGNRDALVLSNLICVVADADKVRIFDAAASGDKQRATWIEGAALLPPLKFGEYRDLEEFIIYLQTHFERDVVVDHLLKWIGSVVDGTTITRGDDGVTQTVAARTGITLVAESAVPNPVIVKPFRTFPEVEQPDSKLVFRVKKMPGEQIGAAFFEADGGAWRMRAIASVAAWLRANLPAAVGVIA